MDELVEEARAAAAAGLASFWVPNYFGMDALTCLAVVGREVPRLRFGTAVVPIYTRHPFAMAQQAMTVQAVLGGRLTLGIGLSHRPIVEGAWGLPFDRPAATMESYLEALAALTGRGDSPAASVTPVPTRPPRGPRSRVTSTSRSLSRRWPRGWWSWLGVSPTVSCCGAWGLTRSPRSWSRCARRPGALGDAPPRVVTSLPVCVTEDAGRARERIDRRFGSVDGLASYRRALDIEGAASLAEIAPVGTESEVLSALRRLEAAGATEFAAMVTTSTKSEYEATIDVLARVAEA